MSETEDLVDSLRETVAKQSDKISRLRAELDEAHSFAETVLARARQDMAAMRKKLADAETSRAVQERNTLAFREDWLREMARADALAKRVAD